MSSEQSQTESSSANSGGDATTPKPAAAGKEEILAELQKRGYDIVTVEHPEVFTVEAMIPHIQHLNGPALKNFFLYAKKKKGLLWLLATRYDRQVNLSKVAKFVGAPGGFRFADEALMVEKIGVGQGCVTPLALYNDKDGAVKLLLDKDVIDGGHEKVFCHPMVNSATTGMKPEDFVKFLEDTGHAPTWIDFETL
ncbi:prolyl-tRNA synthetase associated domain-containing protein 1-like [Glandiceps talaboti]